MTSGGHRTETGFDPSDSTHEWQCKDCTESANGYATLVGAEADAEAHRRETDIDEWEPER